MLPICDRTTYTECSFVSLLHSLRQSITPPGGGGGGPTPTRPSFMYFIYSLSYELVQEKPLHPPSHRGVSIDAKSRAPYRVRARVRDTHARVTRTRVRAGEGDRLGAH